MVTFVYCCPNTGFRVQGYSPEQASDSDPNHFEAVTCVMCRQVHLVNPTTSKVVGEGAE